MGDQAAPSGSQPQTRKSRTRGKEAQKDADNLDKMSEEALSILTKRHLDALSRQREAYRVEKEEEIQLLKNQMIQHRADIDRAATEKRQLEDSQQKLQLGNYDMQRKVMALEEEKKELQKDKERWESDKLELDERIKVLENERKSQEKESKELVCLREYKKEWQRKLRIAPDCPLPGSGGTFKQLALFEDDLKWAFQALTGEEEQQGTITTVNPGVYVPLKDVEDHLYDDDAEDRSGNNENTHSDGSQSISQSISTVRGRDDESETEGETPAKRARHGPSLDLISTTTGDTTASASRGETDITPESKKKVEEIGIEGSAAVGIVLQQESSSTLTLQSITAIVPPPTPPHNDNTSNTSLSHEWGSELFEQLQLWIDRKPRPCLNLDVCKRGGCYCIVLPFHQKPDDLTIFDFDLPVHPKFMRVDYLVERLRQMADEAADNGGKVDWFVQLNEWSTVPDPRKRYSLQELLIKAYASQVQFEAIREVSDTQRICKMGDGFQDHWRVKGDFHFLTTSIVEAALENIWPTARTNMGALEKTAWKKSFEACDLYWTFN